MHDESRLDQLPHPVTFVCKDEARWPELFGGEEPPPAEAVSERFMGARNSWGVQTYIQLRRRGLDVSISADYVPGAICVTTYEDLHISDLPFRSFVVACRHDRGRPEICEMRIVQNQLNVQDPSDHHLPHWPQPGIEPRDPSRGTDVRSVVFQGRAPHLAEPFRSGPFLDDLAAMGMTLSMGEVDDATKRAAWSDYRNADVVLAVRGMAEQNLALKPASKLFNAWLAGCPALLGPEPAFRQLRRSALDYIEVASPAEAVAALRRLRDDPGLYTAMVDNGAARAVDFTPDSVARQWRELLAGPVASRYERWLRASPLQRTTRPVRFALRAVKHRRARRRYRASIARPS